MTDETIPSSVIENLTDFHEKITNLEDVMRPILANSLEKCHENMSPLEKAKLDLVSLYAANSLFWIYLSTKGSNPQEFPVVHELERVKKYMDKVREIEDRAKAPKLNKETTKRFIRNAMFEPDQDKKDLDKPGVSGDNHRSDEAQVQELKSLARQTETSKSSKRKFEIETKKESEGKRHK